MTLRYLGQQPCTVTPLPLANPVADLAAYRKRYRRTLAGQLVSAEELRLLTERDPEVTNPDTESRLRACLPNTSEEERGSVFSQLVECQREISRFDGDPEPQRDYLDQLEQVIDCALRADAEAAGR